MPKVYDANVCLLLRAQRRCRRRGGGGSFWPIIFPTTISDRDLRRYGVKNDTGHVETGSFMPTDDKWFVCPIHKTNERFEYLFVVVVVEIEKHRLEQQSRQCRFARREMRVQERAASINVAAQAHQHGRCDDRRLVVVPGRREKKTSGATVSGRDKQGRPIRGALVMQSP